MKYQISLVNDRHICILLILCLVHESILYSVPIYLQSSNFIDDSAKARLSQADYSSYDLRDHEGPGTYIYGYDVDDARTGNTQFKQEERHPNGTVTGSYGYVEEDGNVHTVYYVADHLGYRARIVNSRDNPQPPKVLPKIPPPLLPVNIPRYPTLPVVNISPKPIIYDPYNNYHGSIPIYNKPLLGPLPDRRYSFPPTNEVLPPIAGPLPSQYLELPEKDFNYDFAPSRNRYFIAKPSSNQRVRING